nr:MAG TPA: hypothetical protein [Caudoviricetes sp.]
MHVSISLSPFLRFFFIIYLDSYFYYVYLQQRFRS